MVRSGGSTARLSAIGLMTVLVACAGSDSPESAARPAMDPLPGYTECEDPRSEMCTREYRPVCAKRDTGIRCVTTPCDSTEWVTRSNDCTACSDPSVLGHRPGACPTQP